MRRALVVSLLLAGAPRASLALTQTAEATLDQGLFSLYNLDYDAARVKFHELIALEPDNPYGYLFEAGAIWWQSSNEYGLFKDTPALEGQFEDDIGKAIEKAESLFGARDKQGRAEARFAAGMALGARGQWNLMRGNWLRAYFDGKKAIQQLDRCIKIDPEFYDAYLGLGVYDYQAARLPGALKLSALIGVRGDEARGIQRMRLALEKGRFSARQAAQFLAGAYLVDRRDYASALPLIRRLREDYPSSPYFHFLEIMTLYHLGQVAESQRSARELIQSARADPALLGRKQLSLFCGLTGPDCFSRADVSSAIEWLSQAIDRCPPEDKGWLSMAYLYRGIAEDILGQRSLAIDDFERVMAEPDAVDSHERARRCLLSPCTKAEVVRMLKLGAPTAALAPLGREEVLGALRGRAIKSQ